MKQCKVIMWAAETAPSVVDPVVAVCPKELNQLEYVAKKRAGYMKSLKFEVCRLTGLVARYTNLWEESQDQLATVKAELELEKRNVKTLFQEKYQLLETVTNQRDKIAQLEQQALSQITKEVIALGTGQDIETELAKTKGELAHAKAAVKHLYSKLHTQYWSMRGMQKRVADLVGHLEVEINEKHRT